MHGVRQSTETSCDDWDNRVQGTARVALKVVSIGTDGSPLTINYWFRLSRFPIGWVVMAVDAQT